MRSTLLVATLLTLVLSPALAVAQGYYQNTVRINPYTGRWEVVPTAQTGANTFGPYRNQRSFYGESYDPASGTLSRSIVQRNPFTGRLEVQNEYFNPYTGARMTEGTRFNSLTGRYESAGDYVPPTNPIPRNAPPTGTAPVVVDNNPPADGAVPIEENTPVGSGTPVDTGAPPRRTTTGKPIIRPKIIENQFPLQPPRN